MINLPPALLNLDEFSLRSLKPDDLELFLSLLSVDFNKFIIEGITQSEELCKGFLDSLKLDMWSIPMVGMRNNVPIGMFITTQTDIQSLNSRLIAIFSEPKEAKILLPLYLRHLFWNFPLQRIYAQFPAMLEDYNALFFDSGFVREGTYLKHQIVGGVRSDIAIFGMLREDFNNWCNKNNQKLSLS